MYKNKVILFGLAFILFFSIFSQTSLGYSSKLYKRTEFSNIYKNPDGTFTAEIYGSPINYFNGHEWLPINTTIVPSDEPNYDYEVKTGNYHAYFKSNPSTAGTVKFEKNKSVTYQPMFLIYRGDSSQQEISNIYSQYGKGFAEGNKFIYTDAFIKGWNLTYQYQTDKLKEELIIPDKSSLPVPESWVGSNIYLELHHLLSYEQNTKMFVNNNEYNKIIKNNGHEKNIDVFTNKHIVFKNEKNKPIFFIRKPYAYDSAGSKIELSYSIAYKNKKSYIYWQVPYKWLIDEKRVYPVYIDPTTDISTSQGFITDDAYTDEGNPNNNYGTTFSAEYGNIGSYLNDRKRWYTEIDFSSLNPTTISSATYYLYHTNEDLNEDPSYTVSAYYCNDEFDERTLTWNNQDTEVTNCDSSPTWTQSMTAHSSAGYVGMDFTSKASSEISDDETFSIKLTLEGGDANKEWRYLYSRESSNKPYFEITYTSNAPPQYSDITVSPSSPQTYGIDEIWFNITWTDDTAVDKAWVVHNFSGSETTYQMINDYGDHYYYKLDFVPSAGNYTYTFYVNDTDGATNQTSTYDYEIQKATTTFHVAIDGNETDMSYTYPTTTNVTAWTDDTEFDGVSLYRNGTSVSNPNVLELGAGVYNYTGVLSYENYTATSVTRWLTINKVPSGLTLTSSNGWTIFSGDSTTITCTADSPLTTTLKVNDVVVSSPYTFNPAVGTYDVNCVVDDQENYTPSSTDKTLLVNPVSSCLDTYVYYKDYSSSASITTLNFTELVNNGYVKPDLSDVEVNVTDAWINTTDGYYFIVNNTGNPFRVQFTNYAKNNTYSTHERSSTVYDVSGYTQQSQSITYNILDEQAGTYMLPPNATLIAYIECPLGENFIDVDTTNFTLASKQYISKAALRVKYTADSYYSRQFYPDEFNDLNLNFYVTDAYENALDRIDFVMVDVNYYDTLLQIYKEREESKMIVTEGYFDSSHMFSAYLLEDTDYYLRVKNADGSYTEFGRISVVVPATKTLGKTTINLNPQAVLIADNLYMNAFMSEDRKTMYIEYNDKLNETDNITITTYFGNGTVFKNETYTGVNSLNLEYNTTGYENESFTVSFSICHETFGNSPVTYSMSLFAPYGFGLGLADYLYQLISLGVLMFVGGLATRRSLIAGILLFSVSLLVFYGIGWLSIPPVFIAFVVVLFALAIIIHLKSGGEE